MQLITPEKATAELNAWLDHKKVSEKKRTSNADGIETLTDALISGTIAIGDDKKIKHTLLFPIENSEGVQTIKELEYKPRLTVGEINTRMKGIKATDMDGRIVAYGSALSGQPLAIMSALDTEDSRIVQAVAMFFI
jgi:hypothetical protein